MENQANTIIYEFPLNNRVRTFLRYEYLMSSIDKALEQENDDLKTIILLHQLLEMIKCNDIKSELIQHLKWQKQKLQTFEESHHVDQGQLENVLASHQKSIDDMDGFQAPMHFYHNHHFLNLMKLRLSIPAGTCGFDIPQLYAWLNMPTEERQAILREWRRPFDPIGQALEVCMRLMRKSKNPETKTAQEGFYTQNLDSSKNHSLLRITINAQMGIYPEVSSGKNRFTMYFFSVNPLDKKPTQVQHNLSFSIVLCSL